MQTSLEITNAFTDAIAVVDYDVPTLFGQRPGLAERRAEVPA